MTERTRSPREAHRIRRRILLPIVLLVVLIGTYYLRQAAHTFTGHAAKMACSLVNISGQSQEEIRSDLNEDNPFMKYVRITWNDETGGTKASLFGGFTRSAIYRPPLGAVVQLPGSEERIAQMPTQRLPAANARTPAPFLLKSHPGDTPHSPITPSAFDEVLAYAFSEPEDEANKRRTRALLAIWKNQIILEQYHSDYDEHSLLLGWSATKSILNLAIGRRIQQGAMELDATHLREEWAHDSRKDISLEAMLRMESGLDFKEDYTNPLSDILNMLTRTISMADFSATFPRVESVGGSYPWNYSSGTSNILSDQLRRSFANDSDYLHFLYHDFLGSIGIHSAQLECDPGGTWVGSSYFYASARDWARFGKLALDDGLWDGQRILPEGWMKKSLEPTQSYASQMDQANPPGLAYGMHWWLNRKDAEGQNWMPSIPEDMHSAWGHADQFVTVIPSRDVIVVRLGNSRGDRKERWDYEWVLKEILGALPEHSAKAARLPESELITIAP